MTFSDFISAFRTKPLIRSQDFIKFEGGVSLVQINRWVKSGKLIQLKRGAYLLAETYRKHEVDPFYLANNLIWPSYISLEKALEYWGLIPEAVQIYTSVTSKRPQSLQTDVGTFSYRHVKPSLLWGYMAIKLGKENSLVATPEKALLDLFYLHPHEITSEFILELRLQNFDNINIETLKHITIKFEKPKITRACQVLINFIQQHSEGYKSI